MIEKVLTCVGDGYTVDYKMVNFDNFKIQEYGEYLYDHIILFCTSLAGILYYFEFPLITSDPKYLRSDKILEFFDSGNNIIIAADIDTSKHFRQLVNQLGVEFDVYVKQT